MDFAAIVQRAKAIALDPKGSWPQIAAEGGDRQALLMGYGLPLLLIGPLIAFLTTSLLGHVPILIGILALIVQALLGVAGFFVSAWIAATLAPSFGGVNDQRQSFKLAVYAATPAQLAAVLAVLPLIGWIIGLAGVIWSVYVLYLGVTPTLRVPPERAVVYVVTLIAIGIGIAVVIGFVLAILGLPMVSRH